MRKEKRECEGVCVNGEVQGQKGKNESECERAIERV